MKSLRAKLQSVVATGRRAILGEPVEDESLWAGSAQSQPKPRLIDPALDRQLEEHGYAVVESFLDPAEVEALIAHFRSEPSALDDKPFASSIRSGDPPYKLRVDEGIRTILEPAIRRHFNGYSYRFAGFLVKAPAGEEMAG